MIEVATILYGSQNYGLDIETSDKDYKIVVVPTFDNLYKGETINTKIDEHNSYLDIRTFVKGLVKGNPNSIELLYSVDSIVYNSPTFTQLLRSARTLYINGYIQNVLPYFLKAARGMSMRNIEDIKGLTRSFYFVQLIFTIVQNDWHLDESLWRKNNFSEKIRSYRLRLPDFQMPQHYIDDLTKLWNDVESYAYDQSSEHGYKERTKEILHLHDLSEQLVKENMYE